MALERIYRPSVGEVLGAMVVVPGVLLYDTAAAPAGSNASLGASWAGGGEREPAPRPSSQRQEPWGPGGTQNPTGPCPDPGSWPPNGAAAGAGAGAQVELSFKV